MDVRSPVLKGLFSYSNVLPEAFHQGMKLMFNKMDKIFGNNCTLVLFPLVYHGSRKCEGPHSRRLRIGRDGHFHIWKTVTRRDTKLVVNIQ